MSKCILVTGGNSGIGLALCRQLVLDRGCHVFLASRSEERGRKAADDIAKAAPPGCAGAVEFVRLDVCSDESVSAAAESVRSKVGTGGLYGLVNNAGTGLVHGTSPRQVLDTNLYGPKRVCDAFLDLIDPEAGRIVNVGSGSGPSYVRGVTDVEAKRTLCCLRPDDLTWDWIDSYARRSLGSGADTFGGYGLSKALLSCYTALLARERPKIMSSIVSPGFIDTKLTAGYGASKTPEEGTVSIQHCLFNKLDGNGWYYGSDAIRSPYHFMRNPGEPAYDGKPPF